MRRGLDSILMRFIVYLVRPTDQNRRAAWLDAIGRETLPVIDGRARSGSHGRLFYDVDMSRLTAVERYRLAALVANQVGSYHEAVQQVNGAGASIPAVGCELLLADDTAVREMA